VSHQVTIENTGERFRCRGEDHVLAAMELAVCKGIPVGCRNGGCGACKVQITQGEYETRKMSRAVVSIEEEARGVALACKVYPHSDISVKAIGARAQWAVARADTSPAVGSPAAAETTRPGKEK